MSATNAGAIKSELEQLSLGLPWFNTTAALRKADGTLQAMPYGVITDYISNVPERGGRGDFPRTTELVQIDVYQDTRDRRHGLVRSVERALREMKLPTAPELVHRVEVQSTVPGPDPDPNVDRKIIMVALRRRY